MSQSKPWHVCVGIALPCLRVNLVTFVMGSHFHVSESILARLCCDRTSMSQSRRVCVGIALPCFRVNLGAFVLGSHFHVSE